MATWYYYNEKGTKIEVSGGKLKGLAKAGLITPDTIVETEDGKTARAGKVRGLTFITPPPQSETGLLPSNEVAITTPDTAEIYSLVPPPKPPSTFTTPAPAETESIAPNPSVVKNPFTIPVPTTTSSFVAPAAITCSNIVYTVADHATGKPVMLLNDISLQIKSCDFVCIIGPSGSGKTTLLKILSGRNKPTHGQVIVGDIDLFKNFNALKKKIAFVPQRDILYEKLSTEAGLTYTAKLRLAPDTTSIQIQNTVSQTIQSVGLTERASTQIENLSGGQRKRSCLGNEILSKPEILFLDEVTSGLDEHSDREIMSLLKDLASAGKAVIMVTHNLANIEQTCNKVIILSKHGCLAFYGTPDEAKEYFGIASLGQIYPVLEKQSPQEWKQKFCNHEHFFAGAISQNTSSSSAQADHNATNNDNRNIFIRQVQILLDRRFRLQMLDLRSLLVIGCQCLLVSLLVSFLFGNINDISDQAKQATAPATIVFLMVVSCLWFGCNNTAKEIVQERSIYLQERDVNLFPSAYLFSKLVFFGIVGSVQASILFGIVCYNTKIDISIFGGWITMLLLTFLGTTIGLCVSIFSKSENFATALVPIILIPQIILAGCMYHVEGYLKIIASLFISAYWGYGGVGSLLDLNEAAQTQVNLEDWSFIPSFLMLILQCCILAGVSIWRLVSETTSASVGNQVAPSDAPSILGVFHSFFAIIFGIFSKTTRDNMGIAIGQFAKSSVLASIMVVSKLNGIVFHRKVLQSTSESDSIVPVPVSFAAESKYASFFSASCRRIIDSLSSWCQITILVSLLVLIIGGLGWDCLSDNQKSRFSDWTRRIRVMMWMESASTIPPTLELYMSTNIGTPQCEALG